ncbi:MAG: CusA/CzcA family heavy metal efflux RND transporter [Methylococcaceae bacterium]
MIDRILAFCLQQRVFVLLASVILIIFGIYAFERLPVQAFPDVQNVFVQVVTQYPGQAPEEIEKLVTLPIERGMNGLPHLINMRSISIFGLSVVTLTFDDDAEDYFSRQQVNERLRSIKLPDSSDTELGPLSTGIGEIYRYVIESKTMPLIEQRAIEDWVIEPRIRTVQGVADVVAFGGGIKEYKVRVNPESLKSYNITLTQVYQAIADNNANIGGGYIKHGDEALVVRGVGLLKTIDGIKKIKITTNDGIPILVGNVADVQIGPQPLTGIVGYNEKDTVVEGIVLLLKGKVPVEVLKGIKEKIADLNDHGLPPGVTIKPIYDRTELVNHTMKTVEHNMIEGILLIVVILMIFLRRLSAALIVGLTIPLSLMFAFILIDVNGISANLVSLGAIDFGVIVDAAVVLVEGVIVCITLDMKNNASLPHMKQSLLHTISQLGSPIVFSQLIIITAFLPIFTFQRVEGKIFSPMAYTISFAMIGSLILSLTLIPVLLSYILGPKLVEAHNPLVHWMEEKYTQFLDWVLLNFKILFICACIVLIVSLGSIKFIGTEFMPKLDEGNIWLTITLPTSITLDKAKDFERDIRSKIETFPDVKMVVTQLGRPEDGTDPKGFNNLEILIDLNPKETWHYKNKVEIIKAMNQKLSIFPGLLLNFSQVIQDNVEEAISGVKGEIAIKVFGSDLKILQEKANQITGILKATAGSTDVAAEQQAQLAQLVLQIDPDKIARYGLDINDIEDVIEIGIGGKAASVFLENERRFNVVVRLIEGERDSLAAIQNITVPTPDGSRIPLSELVDTQINLGASRIGREENMRRISIKCNLIDRDQGSFVAEAMRKTNEQVSLPPGYRIIWSGQFENQKRAMKRLYVIVPISIFLIFSLLFWAFKSVKNALLIILNVPFALIGGLIALLLTHIHLSISAAVGFVALFGIAVQNGVILISQVKQWRIQGESLRDSIVLGAASRLRPVVMTASMAMLGLIPAALSTGVGSETAKPFAIVIIGGLLTATFFTLSMLPALYQYFEDKQ